MRTLEQMINYLEFSIAFYSKKLSETEKAKENEAIICHMKSVLATYDHALKYAKEEW